eukprot:273056_1
MGNDLEAAGPCEEPEPNLNLSNLSLKLANSRNKQTPTDDMDDCTDFISLDERRLVFVSLIGLYQSWRNVPSDALYTSLLLLPLKRAWVFNPTKHIDELQSHFTFPMYSLSDAPIIAFIEFLKRKDAQGLALWMLDDIYELNRGSIHPFWCFVSHFLSNLKDTVTGNKYNRLTVDREFWHSTSQFVSKYGANACEIWDELSCLKMKFNAIQEILFQSNHTLNPIKTYKPTVSFFEIACFEDDESEHEKENWFVSEYYDSYEGMITDEGNTSDDEIIQWSIEHFDHFIK